MTEDEFQEELWNQHAYIDNEGLGYYIQHYGAETSIPELQELYDTAKEALDAVTNYIEDNLDL